MGDKFPVVAGNEDCTNHDADYDRRTIKKVEDKGENDDLWTFCDENHAKELFSIRCDGSKGLHEKGMKFVVTQ